MYHLGLDSPRGPTVLVSLNLGIEWCRDFHSPWFIASLEDRNTDSSWGCNGSMRIQGENGAKMLLRHFPVIFWDTPLCLSILLWHFPPLLIFLDTYLPACPPAYLPVHLLIHLPIHPTVQMCTMAWVKGGSNSWHLFCLPCGSQGVEVPGNQVWQQATFTIEPCHLPGFVTM